MRLEEINKTFLTVKRVGIDGQKISEDAIEIINRIDKLIEDFNAGMQSETWVGNLKAFTGEEAFNYAMEIATVLGEAKAKIDLVEEKYNNK